VTLNRRLVFYSAALLDLGPFVLSRFHYHYLSVYLSINAIAAAATTTCHPPSRYQSARAKALPTTIGTRRLRRHSRLPQGPRRLTTTITTSHLRRTASRTVAGVARVAMVLPRPRRRHHCHRALLHRPVQVACVAESL
jgi:hypothetical protein